MVVAAGKPFPAEASGRHGLANGGDGVSEGNGQPWAGRRNHGLSIGPRRWRSPGRNRPAVAAADYRVNTFPSVVIPAPNGVQACPSLSRPQNKKGNRVDSLSHQNHALGLVAGAGFEPATFGL
ncbi:MAG: hypothetical protein DKINENOH_04539 [bacterium]|nr:hypothetical protein [bacterium]